MHLPSSHQGISPETKGSGACIELGSVGMSWLRGEKFSTFPLSQHKEPQGENILGSLPLSLSVKPGGCCDGRGFLTSAQPGQPLAPHPIHGLWTSAQRACFLLTQFLHLMTISVMKEDCFSLWLECGGGQGGNWKWGSEKVCPCVQFEFSLPPYLVGGGKLSLSMEVSGGRLGSNKFSLSQVLLSSLLWKEWSGWVGALFFIPFLFFLSSVMDKKVIDTLVLLPPALLCRFQYYPIFLLLFASPLPAAPVWVIWCGEALPCSLEACKISSLRTFRKRVNMLPYKE